MASACNHAIGHASLYKHDAKVQDILDDLGGFFLRHTLVFPALIQTICKLCLVFRTFRIDDAGAFQVFPAFLNCTNITKDYKICNTICKNALSSFQCTGVIALRQHDRLLVLLGSIDDRLKECAHFSSLALWLRIARFVAIVW